MTEEQNRTLQDKFMLRLPDGMREDLKEQAKKSGRSMNAEIVHRLANSLNRPTLEDLGFGLAEEIEFQIINAAAMNGRSVKDEITSRLERSLDARSYTEELERDWWVAKDRYNQLMKLHIQLTPEERRLLEERAEIAEAAKDLKISSKEIGNIVRLNPVGNRGRFTLQVSNKRASTLPDVPDHD